MPNPLNQYISGGAAPFGNDGLVVDKVYAAIGVIDTIGNNNPNYSDPNTNQVNTATPLQLAIQGKDTIWTSEQPLDDLVTTSYQLLFSFNQTTYVNRISFDLVKVPCSWFLYQNSVDDANLLSQGGIIEYDTNAFSHINQKLPQTYQFDPSNSLILVVQKSTTGTQYPISIKNFLTKLEVTDINDVTVNGSLVDSVVTTNRLGFVENYIPQTYSVNNILDNNATTFWKCAPQPVGDAVVNFTVDVRNYLNYGSFTGYFINSTTIKVSGTNWTIASGAMGMVGSDPDGYWEPTTTSGLGSSNSQGLVTLLTSGCSVSYAQPASAGSHDLYLTTAPSGYLTGSSNVYSFTITDGVLRPQNLNRMYLDPIYTDTVFNLYYSYDNNYWYPVQRDFRLRKGIYELPTIVASYLKFEFTQLTPEPYQLPFNSIQRTVDVFPTWVDDYYNTLQSAIPDMANQNYAQTNTINTNTNFNQQLNNNTFYGSAADSLNSAWSAGAATNVVNYSSTITDPTISYKTLQTLGSTGALYTPASDVNFITRRFFSPGTHEYKQVSLTQTWHQAYFTGLKTLLLYSTNYVPQLDYPEFTDYFVASGTNSTVASGTATFTPMTTSTVSGFTSTSGGGYSGVTGSTIYTRNFKTISPFDSFKIAILGTDWQPFLTNDQTTLQNSSTLDGLGITAIACSGVAQLGGANYGIFQIQYSGSSGLNYNYIESATGGSANLLTTAEATFAVGGWTTVTGASTVTYSGVTPVTLANNSVQQWQYSYGNPPFGGNALGLSAAITTATNPSYTFMVTASGSSGTFYPVITYSGAGITTVTSTGSAVTITGSTFGSWTSTQPTGATRVDFKVVTSSGSTLSKAGYFVGSGNVWTSPLRTLGMRMSAVARIYLPDTSNGTYRCSLIGYDSAGSATELAFRQVSNLPVRTWLDIEVPYTVTTTSTTYVKFTVRLLQTNGQGENYRMALLGTFYNPLAIEYDSDGTGALWNYVVAGVNDPSSLINLIDNSNQLQLRFTLLEDGATVSAYSVIPNYHQSPYYSTTPIQYLGDTKSNELSWRRAPNQRPLFQLDHELHPVQYDIQVMMGIFNPYYPG